MKNYGKIGAGEGYARVYVIDGGEIWLTVDDDAADHAEGYVDVGFNPGLGTFSTEIEKAKAYLIEKGVIEWAENTMGQKQLFFVDTLPLLII